MCRKLSPVFFIFFILLISTLFFSCSTQEEKANRFYLDNFWQWGLGDIDGTVPTSIITGQGLTKLAINQERTLVNLFEDKKGYVWLRADFVLPKQGALHKYFSYHDIQ